MIVESYINRALEDARVAGLRNDPVGIAYALRSAGSPTSKDLQAFGATSDALRRAVESGALVRVWVDGKDRRGRPCPRAEYCLPEYAPAAPTWQGRVAA